LTIVAREQPNYLASSCWVRSRSRRLCLTHAPKLTFVFILLVT
jgi:hypothetical protein